nr:EamA family transporter [Streptomyces orinoci]
MPSGTWRAGPSPRWRCPRRSPGDCPRCPAAGVCPRRGLLALGALGTGVAHLLNRRLPRRAGAVAATTVAYPMPLVTAAAWVLVLGERLTWNQPVAAVAVGQGGSPRGASASAVPAGDSRI